MISQEPAAAPTRRSFLTIAQLIVSAGGTLASLSAIIVIFLASGFQQLQTGASAFGSLKSNPLIWLLLLLALSGVPSTVLSIKWLKGKEPLPVDSNRWMIVSSGLMIVWVGAAFAGGFLLNKEVPFALLTAVNLLVILLPLAWLLGFALHKLQIGTWKRFWGTVTGTVFLSLPLVILVEGIILIAAVLAVSVLAATMPGMQDILGKLSQLSASSPDQIDALINEITPLITSPGAIYIILLSFGLLVPLVEEFFKPLAVWILSKRRLTPTQGFTIGLISGASFALIESLFAINSAGSADFFAIALGRTGTGLLHTFTTGMMGWALASTWRDGKGLRFGLIYGGSALLHGTWNTLAILMGVGSLPVQIQTGLSSWTVFAPWIMGLLAVWMLTTLYAMNRKLVEEQNQTQTESLRQQPGDISQTY